MGYLGKQPSAVPLTTADLIDGSITSADIADLDAAKLTGTVNNARISLDAAEIPDLAASKITSGTIDNARISLDAAEIPNLDTAKVTSGTFADARISEASVTQHVTAVDLTPVTKDISILALQTAINGNLSAYGLTNSWIEQFENSTFIENISTVSRSSDEYMSSGTVTPTIWPYTNYTDQVFTHNAFNDINGFNSSSTTHLIAKNVTTSMLAHSPAPSGFTSYINFDYLTNYTWTGCKVGFMNVHGMVKTWRLETSTDGSSYSILDMTGATSASLSGYDLDNDDNLAITTDATGLVTNVTNGGNSPHQHGGEITFGASVTTRHLRITVGSSIANANSNSGIDFFVPTYQVVSASATGSFNSTDVTPSDGAAKTSIGLVIMYKDEDGATTLDTDIIAKVRANTGQAYQTLVLRGIDGTTTPSATYSDSMKIAIAPAITVTSGTALSYQISFANQSAGSKEARIHGVAMTY